MTIITLDQPWRENREERRAFARVRLAEMEYARRLRRMASYIHDLVRAYVPPDQAVDVDSVPYLAQLLARYAHTIEPWARTVANRFLGEIDRRDERAWQVYAEKFSRALTQEIRTAPVGQMMNQFLESQVHLITSIPGDAAALVHKLAIEHVQSGTRSGISEILATANVPEGATPTQRALAERMLEIGGITKNRANLIARTESARVSSTLTMVRAQHIGSEGYTWRTMRDRNVRESHREMEGVFVRWDEPPVVDEGKPPYHAGMIFNCRCFCEPTIPDRYGGDYVPDRTESRVERVLRQRPAGWA